MNDSKIERLARILGLVDDDLVTEAANVKKRHLNKILRWSSMIAAACLCIVIIGAVALSSMRMGRTGSGTPSGEIAPAEAPEAPPAEPGEGNGYMSGAGAGEAGEEMPNSDVNAPDGGVISGDSSYFADYEGPILPLSFMGESDGVTAGREITLDFSPYLMLQDNPSGAFEASCLVTDDYVLTNTTDSDLSCTALYPIIGRFSGLNKTKPQISVDGEPVEAKLYYGLTVGTYQELFYGEEFGAARFGDWAECADMLDDEYKSWAFSELPELDERVVVYELSNGEAPEGYDSPTVAISFTIDSTKTRIMPCDLNGYSNEGNGALRFDYFVESWEGERKPILIVLGEDIGDYTLQGYKTGACKEGDEIDIECAVVRREMTFDELLQERAMYWAKTTYKDSVYGKREDFGKILYEAAAWDLSITLDLNDGWRNLDNILECAHYGTRVMYFAVELSIPAGESVGLSAQMTKNASFNIPSSENERLNGFDMATVLGSNLNFTSQSVTLEDRDIIEIVNQNFGFDIENGIKTAELDLGTEHYYLEIVRKNQSSG